MKNLIRTWWLSCLVVYCFSGSMLKSEETPISFLQLNKLSDWESNLGEWTTTSEVKLSKKDISKFQFNPHKHEERDSTEIILVNGVQGKTKNLHTKIEHGDVAVHIEFMVPKGSNSGVYLQGRYEIQILDSHGKKKVNFGDCGGIYERWENGKGFEGASPTANASRPPGRWQTFDAIFRGPKFDKNGNKISDAVFERVIHNGVVIHKNVRCSGPTRSASFENEKATGPIMLQGDHGPVAYRNIWILPLD